MHLGFCFSSNGNLANLIDTKVKVSHAFTRTVDLKTSSKLRTLLHPKNENLFEKTSLMGEQNSSRSRLKNKGK